MLNPACALLMSLLLAVVGVASTSYAQAGSESSDAAAFEEPSPAVAAQQDTSSEELPEHARDAVFSRVKVVGDCVLHEPPGMSEDRKAAWMRFKNFEVEIGPDKQLDTKTCNVEYELENVPPGWRYTVTNFAYNGKALVPPHAGASLLVSYYFLGEGQTGGEQLEIPIPQTQTEDVEPFEGSHKVAGPVAPCSARRPLVGKIDLTLSKRSTGPVEYAWLSLDSAQASMTPETIAQPKVTLTLKWERCPTAPAQPDQSALEPLSATPLH